MAEEILNNELEDAPVQGVNDEQPQEEATSDVVDEVVDSDLEDQEKADADAYIKRIEEIAKERENISETSGTDLDSLNDIENISDENVDDVKLDDAFYTSTDAMFDNIKNTYLNSKDHYWEVEKDKYVAKYGEEQAEVEFDKDYLKKDTEYQANLEKHHNDLLVSYGMTNILYDADDVYEGADTYVQAVSSSLTGSRSMDGTETRALRSRREAMVASGRFVDDQGNVVKLDKDENFLTWWDTNDDHDVTFSDNYKSKDGRQIVGFEYGANDDYLHALYQGDIPKNEILSVWDATGVLASNSLDSSWTDLPKCIGRGTVNLVADAMIGLVELGNSMNVLMGDKEDTEYTRTQASVLNRYKLSKTDYDQEHLFTTSNAVDFIVNTYVQLVLARGVGLAAGGAMSALTKATGITSKIMTAANEALAAGNVAKHALLMKRAETLVAMPSKAASLGVMSLMAGTGIKDEARKAGFSEKAIAGMYVAYLPAMMAASHTSGFLEDVSSMKANEKVITGALQKSMAFADKAEIESGKGLLKWANTAAKKTIQAVKKVSGKDQFWNKGFKGYMQSGMNEGKEEIIEQIYEEGLKQASSAISILTADKSDKGNAPRFRTVTDPGYFSDALQEAAMNFVGGFLGGTMARASFGAVPEAELPFQAEDRDALMKVAAGDQATQNLFLNTLEKNYKKGLLGSHDLLVEIDPKTKLHKKVTDLPEDQRKDALTLAKANRRAILYQYSKYKAQMGGTHGSVKNLEKEFPVLYEELKNSETVYDMVKATYNKIAKFYDGLGDGDPVLIKNTLDTILDQSTEKSLTPTKKVKVEEVKKEEKDKEVVSETAESVAGEEEGVTESLAEVSKAEEVLVSEDAIELAKTTGLSYPQAQHILELETQMRDMMSGKFIEKAFLNNTISKYKGYHILNGSDKDKTYAALGNRFLDAIHASDVKALEVANEIIKSKAVRMDSNAEDIANMLSDEEAFERIKQQIENNDEFYVSAEAKKNLGEQLDEYHKSQLNSEETVAAISGFFNTNAFKGEIIKNVYDVIDTEIAKGVYIDSSMDEEELRELGESRGVSFPDDFDNGYQYGFYMAAKQNEREIKSHMRAKALAALNEDIANGDFSVNSLTKLGIIHDFDKVLAKIVANFDKEINPIDPAETLLNTFETWYGTVDATEENGILPFSHYDTPGKAVVEESKRIGKVIDDKAVSNIPEMHSNDTTAFFGNAFTVNGESVETGDKSLLQSVLELESTSLESLSGKDVSLKAMMASGKVDDEDVIFKGVDEAKMLMKQVDTRIAQVSLLKNSLEALADLRSRNAKIMADKDIRELFDPKAYDNYSKYVSSYVFDPVKYFELKKKADTDTLTEEEKPIYAAMERRHEGLFGDSDSVISDLIQAKGRLITMIGIGDASKTAARLSKAYKNTVASTAKAINDQLEILLSIEESLEDIEAIKEIKNGLDKFDADKATPEDIQEAYKLTVSLADVMYTWGTQNKAKKDALLKTLAGKQYVFTKMNSTSNTSMTDMACYLSVPIHQFLSDYKTTLNGLLEKNPDMNIPTAVQQRVAMHVYVMGLVGLQPTASTVPGSENIIWVEGLYGTGKTTVAAGYGIGTLQTTFEGKYEGHSEALFCSNNEEQAAKLAEIIDSDFNIRAKKGPAKGGFTKNNLIDILESEDAYDQLLSSSFIVYDEATQIQFDPNNKDSEMMRILNGVQRVNKLREKNGIPAIKIVLMGDRAQGGYLKGMPTDTSPTAEVTYPKEAEKENISDQIPSLFRSPALTYQFRSSVTQIKAVTDTLNKTAAEVITHEGAKIEDEITAGYGVISNDPEKHMGGVEVVNSPSGLYTDDLATDLEQRFENEPKFTAVIVDNALKGDPNNMINDRIKALLLKYPDRFSIQTTVSVQGAEKDYVIVNFGDRFVPSMYDVNVSDKYAYNVASMVLGRAKKYVKAYFGKNLKIKSAKQPIMMLTAENDKAIRADWQSFVIDGLLSDIESSKVDPEAVKETAKKHIPAEFVFERGEVVYRQTTNDVRPIKYTVTDIDDDIVEFTDSLGNAVSFNYATQMHEIEKFKKGKLGGGDVTPTAVDQDAIDFAYTYKVETGLAVRHEDSTYTITYVDGDNIQLTNDLTKDFVTIDKYELQTEYIIDAFENPDESLIEEAKARANEPRLTPEMRAARSDASLYKPGTYVQNTMTKDVYKIIAPKYNEDGVTLKSLLLMDEYGRMSSIDSLERFKRLPSVQHTPAPPVPPVVKKDPVKPLEDQPTTTVTIKPAVVEQDTITFTLNGESISAQDLEDKIDALNKKIDKYVKEDKTIPLDVLKEKASYQNALNIHDDVDALGRGNTDNGEVIRATVEALENAFDSIAEDDKVDAKAYMKSLEEEGIGVFYTNRENEFNNRELDASYESARKSYYAAAELYGFSDLERAEVPGRVMELRKQALPVYIRDRQMQLQEMDNFEYYFNTYEYMSNDGRMVIGHALMARHTPTGTPMLLGLIPTNSLAEDGKIAKIIEAQTVQLRNAVDQYTATGIVAEGIKEGFTGKQWTKAQQEGKLKDDRITQGLTNLFIETPIKSKSAVLDLIKQPTIGGFVTGNRKALKQFSEVSKELGEDPAINVFSTSRSSSAEALRRALPFSKRTKKVTADAIKKSDMFKSFDGKGKQFITTVNTSRGKMAVMAIRTESEGYIPFYKDPKHGFIPFFGLDNNGEIIEDSDILTDFLGGRGLLYNKEYTDIKEVLDKSFPTLPISGTSKAGYKGITTKPMKQVELVDMFASLLGYSPKLVTNNTLKDRALFEAVSEKALKKAVKNWNNWDIPIKTFDAMMDKFGRNKAGLKMSPLMVFRSTNPKYRGRLFRLYTYNPDYDLNDDADLEKIKSKLAAALKDGSLNDTLLSREGIGIMEVNAQYSSFQDVYSFYKSGIASDEMNKLVVPAKSEASMRLVNMFIEMANIYNSISNNPDYSRINDNKHLFGADGITTTILREDSVSQKKLKAYLTSVSNDEEMMKAQEALKHIIMSITHNDALGKLRIRPTGDLGATNYNGNDPISGQILLNKDTGQPSVFNDDPITLFPSSLLEDAVLSGNLESEGLQLDDTVRFNLHALFGMIDQYVTDEGVKNKVLEMVDTVMTRFSKSGTLNKGLNISPSVAGTMGLNEIWSKVDTKTVDAMGKNALDRCTVRVKDIKQPNVLYNIDALADVIEGATKVSTAYKSRSEISAKVNAITDKLRADIAGVLVSTGNKEAKIKQLKNNAITKYNAVIEGLHPNDVVARRVFKEAILNEVADGMAQLARTSQVSSTVAMQTVFDNIEAIASHAFQSSGDAMETYLADKYLADFTTETDQVSSKSSQIKALQQKILGALIGNTKEDILASLESLNEEAEAVLPAEAMGKFKNIKAALINSEVVIDKDYFKNWLDVARAYNMKIDNVSDVDAETLLTDYFDFTDKPQVIASAFSVLLSPDVEQGIKTELEEHLLGEDGLLDYMDLKDSFVDFLRNNHNESIKESAAYQQLVENGVDIESIPSIQTELEARKAAGGLMFDGETGDEFIAKIYASLESIKADTQVTNESKIQTMEKLKELVSSRLPEGSKVLDTINKVITDMTTPTETLADKLLAKFAGKLSDEATTAFKAMAKDMEAHTTPEFQSKFASLLGGELNDDKTLDFMMGEWTQFLQQMIKVKGRDYAKAYDALMQEELANQIDNKKGCNSIM